MDKRIGAKELATLSMAYWNITSGNGVYDYGNSTLS